MELINRLLVAVSNAIVFALDLASRALAMVGQWLGFIAQPAYR